MKISILDCTLRDGGYINNWEFSNSQITKIIDSLSLSKIDIIECGYLDDKKGMEINSTIFNFIETVDKLIDINDNTSNVVMVNFGDYDISKLPLKKDTKIDGIRLAFHKKNLVEALDLGKQINDLGYKLYFQPMVTKNYKDIEFLSMIESVNELKPYAFYIVDSFGSMTLNEFNRYLVLSDNNLDKNISLGYHSHNNMQLAFSNAISMCSHNFARDIIIDSSIYGIGRGAGNLNTELITDYLNSSQSKKYNTLPLLEIIDEFLHSLMKKNPWGFSPAQYLSASFNCHPNYATYLINKNTNHIVGVRKVLEKLPNDKKVSFDKTYIEELYIESLLEVKSEIKGELQIDENKEVLLLASGKSVISYEKEISKKINSNGYVTIALNHKPQLECDYYFFSNQKRYDEFYKQLNKSKIIITSNVLSNIDVDMVLNFKDLAFVEDDFISNVALIAINYVLSTGKDKIEIAGLDGYKIDTDNYNYKETSVIVDNKELLAQNEAIQKSLDILKQKIEINFLTPSIFNQD